MGVIENVYVPSIDEVCESVEESCNGAWVFDEIASSERILKRMYDKVVEAIYYTSSYKVLFERAYDSMNYAERQMTLAKSKLDAIEDENKDNITRDFINDLDVFERLKSIASDKNQKCQTVIDKLNEYKRKIIDRNNLLADRKSKAQGLAYALSGGHDQ
jgi:hypothetical protein